MVIVPEQYVVKTFFECVSNAKYNRHSKNYQGSCPFCREGNSFGKKERFYYLPKKELAFCHNCGYSKKAFNFILDVTGKPFNIVIAEIRHGEYDVIQEQDTKKEEKKQDVPSLPRDCINLTDETQLKFHEGNAVVSVCLNFIKARRLDTAINRPKTYYLSLTDDVHRNRLVLPFYNQNGDIIYYQTRTLLPADMKEKPKYLSKVGAEKSLSGINQLDQNIPFIFLFEGPIDSYFAKNGAALCGIQDESEHAFTELQKIQLNSLPMYERVWCLDNQWNDKAALKKSLILVDQDEKVFIWPEELRKYKDANEYCIATKQDSISTDFILKNTYKGLKAKIILTKIKSTCT